MTSIRWLSCLTLLLGATMALAQEEPARPLFYTPNDVILVLGATPQEVPVYREAMKDAQLRRTGGVEYWEGHIDGKAVDLAETGVGKARASTVAWSSESVNVAPISSNTTGRYLILPRSRPIAVARMRR